MYVGLKTRLPYQPPWALDFSTRRRWLSEGDTHIAYIYELEDTSTFRYRIFNMAESLRANPAFGISAGWFTRRDFHSDISFLDAADIVVICRTRYDHGVARLVERARARGILVLYDTDDLVFDPRLVHLIMHTLDVPQTEEEWNYWYAYTSRLGATMALCDGVLTSTPYLAEQVRMICPSRPCVVIPNFLNQRQTQESDLLFAKKRANRFSRDGRVTIAYLSGSPSHNADLLVASPALAAAMEDHANINLRLVGFTELNDYLAPYARQIEQFPLQDYLNLQRVTAESEFSIAPLQSNVFTNCKSELKYFEPGAVGCPVIASPNPAFKSAITDGVNGYLAEPHQWHERVEDLYNKVQSQPDQVTLLGDTVMEDSRARYGWDTQAARILDAINSIRDGVAV